MINTISHIPASIKKGVNKIPRSQNKVVNCLRSLVVLTLLSPGSCVGASAAGSWVYNKINGLPESAEIKSGIQNNEEETDPFLPESALSYYEEVKDFDK